MQSIPKRMIELYGCRFLQGLNFFAEDAWRKVTDRLPLWFYKQV
jgi:hypothetical protein